MALEDVLEQRQAVCEQMPHQTDGAFEGLPAKPCQAIELDSDSCGLHVLFASSFMPYPSLQPESSELKSSVDICSCKSLRGFAIHSFVPLTRCTCICIK